MFEKQLTLRSPASAAASLWVDLYNDPVAGLSTSSQLLGDHTMFVQISHLALSSIDSTSEQRVRG